MDKDTGSRELSKAYLEKGLALIALDPKSKRPIEKDWNTPDKAITKPAQLRRLKGKGIGCALAYCTPRLVSIDIDNLDLARVAWRNAGLNLDNVLSQGLQITSNRPNRKKALFSLPARESLLLGVHCNSEGYELRCSTKDSSRTEQDVLPPTIHPSTNRPYEWVGAFTTPPEIPNALLIFWKEHFKPKNRSANAKVLNEAITTEIIKDALHFIDNQEYHMWLGTGMSLHSADEDYLELWIEWSGGNEEVCECKWRGFKIKSDGRTLASLFHDAKELGWSPNLFIDAAIAKDPKHAIRLMAAIPLDAMDQESSLRKIASAANVNKKTVEQQLKSERAALFGGGSITEMTHNDMAKEYIGDIGIGNIIGAYGRAWIFNGDGIYNETELDSIGAQISDMFNQQPLCKRAGDYNAIAAVIYNRSKDEKFFELENAPRGLATASKFWQLTKEGIEAVELEPIHRQRFYCPVEPADIELEMWPEFLGQCFGDWRSNVPTGSEETSIARLQELCGAIMFQLVPMFQTAWLFYGPGDSGKSTMLHVLEHIIPREMTVAVPPTDWDKPYFRAELAGKLLNVAGEIAEDKIIGEHFKKIVGGDRTDGRFPYLRVFYYTNTAAHIFMVNKFPWVKDRSWSMMRRWQVLGFMNPVKEKVRDFHKDLIRKELPGIIWWAMEGAVRLMRQNEWTKCLLHKELMTKWSRDVNTALAFVNDDEWISLGGDDSISNTILYEHYLEWCSMQRVRNPFGKNNFKSELQSSGFKYTTGGRDLVRGFKGINKVEVL